MTLISEIQSDIETIESTLTLYEDINFNNRADAIDFMEFHIIDRIEGLLIEPDHTEEFLILKQRAEKLKSLLEEIDTNLFKLLRQGIATGVYTGAAFVEMVNRYTGYSITQIGVKATIDYDNLDIFINYLLSDHTVPEATTEREAEMVFYQKTPARIVFEMVTSTKIKAGDVFFDLGSGLGQVSILVNLISGANALGVEYEPAYCNYANACASLLHLTDVHFINADARAADYSQGTIFFLYTPFEGSLLQEVLDLLQNESIKRTIRIFTYGPCSPVVSRQEWLHCLNGGADDPYKLYEFESLNQ